MTLVLFEARCAVKDCIGLFFLGTVRSLKLVFRAPVTIYVRRAGVPCTVLCSTYVHSRPGQCDETPTDDCSKCIMNDQVVIQYARSKTLDL